MESREEGKKLRKSGWNFSKFDQSSKFSDPRTNPQRDNHKKKTQNGTSLSNY